MPTRDHDVIRRWADDHDAMPAQIHPRKFDGEPAVLHFLMRGTGAMEGIEPVSWETFFALFDLMELAFAYDKRSPQFNLVKIDKGQSATSLQ